MFSKGNCASLVAELERQASTSHFGPSLACQEIGKLVWDRTSLGAKSPNVGFWLMVLQNVTNIHHRVVASTVSLAPCSLDSPNFGGLECTVTSHGSMPA
jgi:hypothetical protein